MLSTVRNVWTLCGTMTEICASIDRQQNKRTDSLFKGQYRHDQQEI